MAPPPPAYVGHVPRRALTRLAIALATGVAIGLAVPARLGLPFRTVAAWNAAALVLSTLAWWIIYRATPAQTCLHAADDDPGRRAVQAVVLVASGFSLFATAVLLPQARAKAPEARGLFVVLCALAVASSWLLTHIAYALHYAHLYYRDEGEGGLAFPGGGDPAYLDFAYFAFTIGMCFQVSDVAVSSRPIRRAVLGHAVLSFVYNTAILATVVNLLVGMFG